MKKVYAGVFAIVLLAVSCLSAVPRGDAVVAASVMATWEILAPMPTARSMPSLAVLDGKIYAFGGQISSGSTNVNEVYDIATNTWTTLQPTSQAVGSAVVVFENKIYCFGWEKNQIYDPVTDEWEMRTPSPNPRGGASASVVNDKIYLIGGVDSYTYNGLPRQTQTTLNEMYDPATDSWTTMAPMLISVVSCRSAALDGKIYVFGNGDATQIYDTQTDMWSYGPATPGDASYGAAAATTGVYAPKRVYRIGGLGLGLTQIFDPETQSWSTDSPPPTNRRALNVAVVDDRLYAIGGVDNSVNVQGISNANERYTPIGYTPVPPAVQVVSPEQNETYTSGYVSLTFTVDKPFTELSYSLDGEENVTLTGNTTLTGLSNGLHNVTVYAMDSMGSVGVSETVSFIVAVPVVPEPFPTALAITASGASLAVVGLSLLVYFKKRKH